MPRSILLLPLVLGLTGAASGQPAAPTPGFQSIELQGGGLVTVRHGPAHEVTVSYANPHRPIRTDGDRLVIGRCTAECPNGHHIEVEVTTSAASRLVVADGGIIHVAGDFPRQAALAASVSDGGTVDVRWLEAGSVSASVSNGGRILARPLFELVASITDGGHITYWGDAAVTSSVQRGGVVAQGEAADLRTPLALPRRGVTPRQHGKE